VLFVSTLEPRKNLPTLLQALRICIDRRPEAGYRLVIVGRRGWRDDAIFQAARDLKLADHVLFTGGVGQYDLRWLYNACRLYINPSLYEGFGLPLLEAMACGAPCLAAATSSLPEIGGEAAIYVPPLEAEQWPIRSWRCGMTRIVAPSLAAWAWRVRSSFRGIARHAKRLRCTDARSSELCHALSRCRPLAISHPSRCLQSASPHWGQVRRARAYAAERCCCRVSFSLA